MSYSTETMRVVAGEVRAWLGRRNITANKAATALGWSQPYISRRLTGEVHFSAEDLRGLGELLDVDPLAFFDAPQTSWSSPEAGHPSHRPSSHRGSKFRCTSPLSGMHIPSAASLAAA